MLPFYTDATHRELGFSIKYYISASTWNIIIMLVSKIILMVSQTLLSLINGLNYFRWPPFLIVYEKWLPGFFSFYKMSYLGFFLEYSYTLRVLNNICGGTEAIYQFING